MADPSPDLQGGHPSASPESRTTARNGRMPQTERSSVPPPRSSRPSAAAGDSSRPTTKPLLASEALMDDLAPLRPGERRGRLWCLVMALAFAAAGALPLFGIRPGGGA